MQVRHGAGAALLVAGYGVPAPLEPILHTLSRIGEALLATTTEWRVRRLSPLAGDRNTPDCSGLKRHLTQLADQDVDVIVLALAGLITAADDRPALVTADDHAEYPRDATLALDWIRDCLRTCRASRAVIVASVESVEGATRGHVVRWLSALGTVHPGHVVAIDPSGGRALALSALLDGLGGAALDPGTGTTTMRSISAYLVETVPGVGLQASDQAETLASSPPLAGPWDARLTSRVDLDRGSLAAAGPLIGTVLPGRFRVDRMLARGSFGTVYLARQLTVDREVAVKVLEDSVDPSSDLGRLFVHEIQSVGRIDHPNVVRVLQADMTAGGQLFFVMELLAGLDLQQLIERDGPMAKERAVGLVRQLLAGLAAAHDAGLVHADVKPANAFVVAGRGHERAVLLDFGLSRLRTAGQLAESAGGTPAYMAPEQLNDGRVDSRSDLFAVALVLVSLLTGWRRRNATELVPPLDAIDDAGLREVLGRALALAPDDRYQSAEELADALVGAAATASATVVRSPFRHLASFTEADRDHLRGRDREISRLVEDVLFRRAVIYTAPSGTGKTSLLRAGMIARLAALGIDSAYVAYRSGAPGALADAIWSGAERVGEAVVARWTREHRRLVVMIDQLEQAVATGDPVLDELAGLERLPDSMEISVVLAVREDFLASLMAHDGFNVMPVLRLGPLTRDAAREAIVGPLLEHRIAITGELLTALLEDLNAAGLAVAHEMRWSPGEAIYPPHLQLACSVLYEALGPGEATLELAHYRRLGGLQAIVGEYLDRVLENELPPGSIEAARELLLALVHPNQTRAFCTEAELVELLATRYDEPVVAAVLEALRARGLIVRLRSPTGEPGWELVHDSLVPRVLAWVDRRDLARRRAIELVRYHLRRSRADSPSLLGTEELGELRDHASAVDELHAEWLRRGVTGISPARLVQLSRRARRLRVASVVGAIGVVATIAGALGYRWLDEREQRRREELIVKADLGRVRIELAPFDWDPRALAPRAVEVADLAELDWELYEPAAEDLLDLGGNPRRLMVARKVDASTSATARAWLVEVRGGAAVLAVSGRGRRGETCPRSLIPVRRLPGFAGRELPVQTITVRVPSCRATFADMVLVPAGPYISGGLGEPPPTFDANLTPADLAPEATIALAAFEIDRTEVTNAAFRLFTVGENPTTVEMPEYPQTPALAPAGGGGYPVADLEWSEARAYCRFLGKQLPTDHEWEKAKRGGLQLDGKPNPRPRRNLPWREDLVEIPANLDDTGVIGPAPVGSSPGDVSPYGVLDLAGNVQEWTGTETKHGFVVTRGCNWTKCNTGNLVRFMAIGNERGRRYHNFELGFRCALAASAASPGASSTR